MGLFIMNYIATIENVIAAPSNYDNLLCEFYGKIFQDRLEHYVCICGHISIEIDTFGDIVTNVFGVQFAIDLITMEDEPHGKCTIRYTTSNMW